MAELTHIRQIEGMERYSVAVQITDRGYRAVLISTENRAVLVSVPEREMDSEANLDTFALSMSMMLGKNVC